MTEAMDRKEYGDFATIGLPLDYELYGKYKVKEYVSMGHINLVYLAVNKVSQKKVLIKEFCPYEYANRDLDRVHVVCKGRACRKQYDQACALFAKECEIHKLISKYPEKKRKNIVKFIECFEENGTKYLVLEYIPGQDLKSYIQIVPNLQFISIAKEIVRAVKQIHAMGILHKDIKPSNLIVGDDGHIYIIDFGTADKCNASKDEYPFVSKGFSAPELYRLEMLSKQTDIYSLGAIFYYLLTGRVLQSADQRLVKDQVIPISADVSIPWLLEWGIMKCVRLDPNKRWKHLAIYSLLL